MKIKYKSFNSGDHDVRDWIKKNFKYHFETHSWDDMALWCKENFGSPLYTIESDADGLHFIANENAVWDYWGNWVFFKNANDAMLFKLKWKNDK
jgi:hypothetical protein